MKSFLVVCVLCLLVLQVSAEMETKKEELAGPPVIEGITWQKGPCTGRISNIGEIQIPVGYVFTDAAGTKILMEIMQNPSGDTELALVGPESLDWFFIFEFDAIGYVKDNEKDELDADAMLSSIKVATEASNKERESRGWPAMHINGWQQKPQYNEKTHNLEWAIIGESSGEVFINYNTRILGRKGVMRITLVDAPDTLDTTLPKFRNMMGEFNFTQGSKYAEFKSGDKIAKYGLSALVVGGAAAVAAKSGMFRWLWKLLVGGFLVVAGFCKKLFGKKKSA